MLPKQATRRIISLLMVIVLVVGGLISLPAIQSVEAAINIGQTGTQTNTCGLILVPVLCTNNADNQATVTPAPVATQDIDITGTQNIDQTNACDDDDGSECLNESSAGFGLGNVFRLEHDQAADVSIESFKQNIQQENDCFLFDQCDNFGGNSFSIFGQDDDGILATGTDVDVGSSIQDINQLNDCDGNIAPDPLCSNDARSFMSLNALEDGDINLGESSQTVQQENQCVDGNVACDNQSFESLQLFSAGPNAEINLDTNTQQMSQGNECSVAGTTCSNSGGHGVALTAVDDGEIDISDNTQTYEQTNQCSNTGVTQTICNNSGGGNTLFAVARDVSTLEGSNQQQKFQSNGCTDSICFNSGNNFHGLDSSGESSIESDYIPDRHSEQFGYIHNFFE